MKKQVLFIVLMLIPLMASAQTEINGIYYNLNSTTKVAEVTSGTLKYTGSVVIPKTVIYGGVTYSVTSIGWSAFSDCSGLTSITIPNSVTSIGGYAFYFCSSLTSITIPNSVTSIDSPAFYGCSGLTSIIVENGNTVYDSRNNCNAIIKTSTNVLIAGCKSTIIPNSVTSIGNEAFVSCSGLTSVTIPNSVTSIGGSAFMDCSALTSVTIGNSVTSIGETAFASCSGLTSITIPNSVTDIGGWAFGSCSGLTSVSIPNSLTYIGYGAFQSCSSLTSVTIPNSVTSIEDMAFYRCSGLTSIIIGRGIETIGSSAFASCESLEDVYCHAEKVPSAEINAFDNSYISYATLHVPENSVNQYRRREPWSGFETITGILEEEYNDDNKCEKPVITLLANGKIKVESATEGATCVTNITASNAEPLSDGEISLNTPLIVYTVTSYATKEGYDDSEVASATFRYEKAEGDMNGDGTMNIADVIHLVNMILGQ